jgi:hypothetical protein
VTIVTQEQTPSIANFVTSFTAISFTVAVNIIVGALQRVSSVRSQKYAERKPKYLLF